MTRLRRHLTYSNVISTLCLFLLLGGGSAYALSGENTVFTDDIVDEEVKTADIAPNAIGTGRLANGAVQNSDLAADSVTTVNVQDETLTAIDIAPESLGSGRVKDGQLTGVDIAPNTLGSGRILDGSLAGVDVANNSLKGADIDEGSLNGALIPGIATSGLVKSSGVVKLDDPDGGLYTTTPLLSAGPFTITGRCGDFSGNIEASVFLFSSVGDWSLDGDADGSSDELTGLPEGAGNFIANASSGSAEPSLDVGDYAATTPAKLLTGEVFAGESIMGSDCVFGVTGIG